MAFENLSARLGEVFRSLRGRGRLTEADVDQALREVRLALLEADVNFRVVRDFVARVRERAVGAGVLESLTPGQQVIQIVHEELVTLLGGTAPRWQPAPRPPTVIMLVGLQGSGKTTTAGKLAHLMKRQGHRPLLAAADVYRPAAIAQLETIGRQLDVPVVALGEGADPVDIGRAAVARAAAAGRDVAIIDTAGRLHVDDELMAELVRMREAVRPHQVLLVVDAMTGQDAVNAAAVFSERVGLDGVILTKLDGDARGGAALSVRAVTGRPVLFAGMGEKLDALEPFHPDRMAGRILGMGDVLTLIEKAQETVDRKQAEELERKLRRADFTLDDFLEQLEQVRRMGPLDQLVSMIPGMQRQLAGARLDPRELGRTRAIVQSMTRVERRNPDLIDGSRRRRIARGSGTTVQDVNRLLRGFEEMRRMMKQLSRLERGGRKGGRPPFPF